jgi:mRNA-degrading endonuclease toxin of MazEF toxin-antitoxin module
MPRLTSDCATVTRHACSGRSRTRRGTAISCDNITTVARADIGDRIGFLRDEDEAPLLEAIAAAYDLDLPLPT